VKDMTTIRPDLERLREAELGEAGAKFPPFHSLHEGYGVLREEICEAEEALSTVQVYFERLWAAVRADSFAQAGEFAARIQEAATDMAMEAVQVAAMGEKLVAFVKGGG